ncbi:MAG: hypothetical protein Q9166_003144 [cf. Caloplaca sp. 2 TL-2023]
MLLWVLCLKLWWLSLPLGTLQHPSRLEENTITERLDPRDANLQSEFDNANAADEIDRRALEVAPLVLAPNGGKAPPATGPLPSGFMLSPLVINYKGPGILLNYSSNNPDPFPYPAGRGPYPPDPYPPGPDPYPPGPDPYPPGPYPPDPYPPYDPDTWSFDWAYPPWGSGRKLFEFKGNINLKTTDTQLYVTILGYAVGDFKGNLDTGMLIDVNIAIAKGYLKIYLVDGEPKDQVWLIADLHLPFRQHFYKKIHMFDLPHHPGPPPRVAAANETA